MARSEEDTIVSVAGDGESNDYSPSKVYKPRTWPSQPGAHFSEHESRRRLSDTAPEKEGPDRERRRKAADTKVFFKHGGHEVNSALSKEQLERHAATKALRKRVPTATTKHRHEEPPASTRARVRRPHSSVPEVSGTHSSERYQGDAISSKHKKREEVPYPERSNRAKSGMGAHDRDSSDISENRTRTIHGDEVDREDGGKDMAPKLRAPPTSPASTQKEHSHIRLTEGKPGHRSLWRKVLNVTSIPASLPEAPTDNVQGVPVLSNEGLAEGTNSAGNTSSEVLVPEPNSPASVPEDSANSLVGFLNSPEKKDPDVYPKNKSSSAVAGHGAAKIPPSNNSNRRSSPARKDQAAAAAGAGHVSPSRQPPSVEGAAAGNGFNDEGSEAMPDYPELMHGVLYYVWVLSSVFFVLLAVPVAALLLSHKGTDVPAHHIKEPGALIITLGQQGCIDDANSTLVCAEYPVTSKTMEDPSWPIDKPVRAELSANFSDEQTTVVRPVICVLNLSTPEMWKRLRKNALTWTYCAVLVLESLTVGTPTAPAMGRRGTFAFDRTTFSEILYFTWHFVSRGKGTLPIYVTVGGERADSAAFASLFQHPNWETSVLNRLDKLGTILDGINLYWNHPGDNCDVNKTLINDMDQRLVRKLKRTFTGVMLTVPPSRDLVRHFGLTNAVLEQLTYVLVATHKLGRCDNIVHCGGARQLAASAFLGVRSDYDVRFWNKFAYSISARASIYLAKKISSGSKADGTPSEFRTEFRNKSPEVLGLADLCHAKRVVSSGECTLAILDDIKDSDGVTWHRLAAYTSPHQMRLRMRRAFDDTMGNTAVALFDSQLDDLTGVCNRLPHPELSPLLVALATGGEEIVGTV